MSPRSNNRSRGAGAPAKKSNALGLILGRATNADKSKKAHKEKVRRQQKARAKARDISSFIGYDALYKDGIAQVEEGLFSQTVELSDISYQSARRESQQNIFTVLSSLYNYFGADSSVQLTIANVPIPQDEIGRKRFFPEGDPDTREYAREYNRILNDKMREGVSNLTRHRYLTYMVGANDVDEAAPKLSRIRGDVADTLGRIRCDTHALNGEERLAAIQSQLRPKSDFTFSWDKISPKSNVRTKDLIAPALIDFKPLGRADVFRVDETFGCVLSIRTFGSMLEDYYLANIIDLPMPLSVNLHIQPIVQSDALALVKRQLDWMDKEIIDEQMSAMKKGYDYTILPPELRYSKEEAEELLDFLRNKNERLFTYTGLVPGCEYTASGILMDKATGEPALDDEGNQIEASTTFTAEESCGEVEVTFTFKGASLAGKKLVAFETMELEGTEYMVHADIDDVDQTVNVVDIATQARDGISGTSEGTLSENGKLIDTVAYTGLAPGVEYRIFTTLIDKSTGNPLLGDDGLPKVGTMSFTPDSPDGTVDVTVEMDTTALEETSIVFFEKLADADENVIAVHEDIDDEGQTVTFPEPEAAPDEPVPGKGYPKTGAFAEVDPVTASFLVIALCGCAGATYAYIRRSRNQIKTIDARRGGNEQRGRILAAS